MAYLTHLARHPKTARRIATKLAVRFVADSPPSALVDRLAAGLPRQRHRDRPRAQGAVHLGRVRRVGRAEDQAPAGEHRLDGARPRRHPRARHQGLARRAWSGTRAAPGRPRWAGRPRTATPTSPPAWAGAGAILARVELAHGPGLGRHPDHAATRSPTPPCLAAARRRCPTTHGALVDALADPPAARRRCRPPRATPSAPSSTRRRPRPWLHRRRRRLAPALRRGPRARHAPSSPPGED